MKLPDLKCSIQDFFFDVDLNWIMLEQGINERRQGRVSSYYDEKT